MNSVFYCAESVLLSEAIEGRALPAGSLPSARRNARRPDITRRSTFWRRPRPADHPLRPAAHTIPRPVLAPLWLCAPSGASSRTCAGATSARMPRGTSRSGLGKNPCDTRPPVRARLARIRALNGVPRRDAPASVRFASGENLTPAGALPPPATLGGALKHGVNHGQEEMLEFPRVVKELPAERDRSPCRAENGHEIIAHTAGKMRKNRIRVRQATKGASRNDAP